MYCEKCGKKLEDGEVCSCKATAEAAPAETPAAESTAVVAAPAQQTLPDTQKLADGVKAIGSNPVVTELISVIKGAFTAPVKQTGKSAKRTDILWIILAAVEAIIASVSITVVFRHLLHVFLGSAAGTMSGKLSFGDFAEGLAAMDAGVWKTFGFAILGVLIMYVIGTALMFIISLIYKRNASFASVCNMLATANIPGTASCPYFRLDLCSYLCIPYDRRRRFSYCTQLHGYAEAGRRKIQHLPLLALHHQHNNRNCCCYPYRYRLCRYNFRNHARQTHGLHVLIKKKG